MSCKTHEDTIRFCGGVKGRVWLFLRRRGSTHQREIARNLRTSLFGVQVALQQLEAAGFVESREEGNRLYYQCVTCEITVLEPVAAVLEGVVVE